MGNEWESGGKIISLLLMLIVSSPIKGAILLLLSCLIMILSWNLSIYMYLLRLIYVRGLLVLLLYITTFRTSLYQRRVLIYFFFLFIVPLSILRFYRKGSSYNLDQLYIRNISVSFITLLILLLRVLVVVSYLLRTRRSFRALE